MELEGVRHVGPWPVAEGVLPEPAEAGLEGRPWSYGWNLWGVGGHLGEGMMSGQQQEGGWPNTGGRPLDSGGTGRGSLTVQEWTWSGWSGR